MLKVVRVVRFLQISFTLLNMIIHNDTKASKVAARIIREAGRINRRMEVTISDHAPESVKLTGTIPGKRGWSIETDIPLKANGRRDYVRFLKETRYTTVFIRLSTKGGRTVIYVK
jgi:hypothetical protein